MALFGGKKDTGQLIDVLLKVTPHEQREKINAHFSGMGNHEICTMFFGPHWRHKVEKIYKYADSKPKQIKVWVSQNPDGGCIFYIRGTFTKDDAKFLIEELLVRSRPGDKMLAEPKWITRIMKKRLGL